MNSFLSVCARNGHIMQNSPFKFSTMKVALLVLAEFVSCWTDSSDRDANLTHVYPMNYVFAETTEFMRVAATGFELLLGQHGVNVFKHFHTTDLPIKFPMMNKGITCIYYVSFNRTFTE